MSFADTIKSNPGLKKLVHRALIPGNEHRPRWWVRTFVNPFLHKWGKGSIVRRKTRLDILPFNKFSLGARAVIEDFSTVNNGVGDVTIGHDSTIGMSCVIIGPVSIGNKVILAQNIVVSGLNHGYEDVTKAIMDQKVTTMAITIEDEVWIGANCVITAGVTIGKHAVVGGGSVVTKDVQPYSIVVGNPARMVKQYDFEREKWIKV